MELQLPSILSANKADAGEHVRVVPRTPTPARHLVLLTCMDSRIDPARAFGLRPGEAHVLRNAGGRASTDAIRSLIVSTQLLGTREVGIVHHTNCGLEGVSNEDFADRIGVRDVDFLGFASVENSVREDVAIVRACRWLPDGLAVWGAVYDVDTGGLTLIEAPDRT